ncbi:MAG: hypothetical protein KBD01_04950 [Acidobacteria bacterium]|nr:hypothetical protein [Acidobacteriota bacterium]
MRVRWESALVTVGLVAAACATPAAAHCDTLDGPVVAEARQALEKGEVAPVLKWIAPEREAEIRAAFQRALAVRSGGPAARELADTYFFETLVRVHRAGEGAPYTGLKPAGSDPGPAVTAADAALAAGNADELVKLIADEVAAGLRTRFARARAARAHAEHNVDAGRDYVAAYVEFVHYAERLHADATSAAAHAAEGAAEGSGHHH